MHKLLRRRRLARHLYLKALGAVLVATACTRPIVIPAPDRAAVIRAAAELLAQEYIYEDVGRTLADSLQQAVQVGRFAGLSDTAFATAVRSILFRISADPHLGFESAEPREAVRSSEPSSPAAPAAPTGLAAFGIGRADFVEPGVAYLELLGFSGEQEALHAIDSIMDSFAEARALIIDLRNNTGGGPQMVRHLSTYFFESRTHLVSTQMRGNPAPIERWTVDTVSGRRMPHTPVYILTSRRTFSAAESFTFGLRVNNRVTIVGEPTGGGGHFGQFHDLPGGFVMFVPYGRTYDPRTNKGWQAEGIQPDVVTSSDNALDAALALIRARREGGQ
jgi:hypothetical protein